VVDRGEDLVGELHDVDFGPAVPQVFGHLEADVARADDDGAHGTAGAPGGRGEQGIQFCLDLVHVADSAQHVNARQVDARNRRANRFGPRRQGEFVVRLGVLGAVVDAAHRDGLRRAVDRNHFVADAHVEVECFPQALGRLHEQPAAIGDDTADVVRQAAVRERHVVTALEHDDLGELVKAAGAGGDGCSGGDSADDDEFHSDLLTSGSISTVRTPASPRPEPKGPALWQPGRTALVP
jgi:hypothetical protein